jgi:tRNA threonylcarbamoyl adenosine modification protein (Sua5/YciO/YrdC/YwlC family)
VVKLHSSDLDSSTVAELAIRIRDGGVGIWHTDTVYGYFCIYNDASAQEKIVRFKGREADKPFSLAFANVKSLLEHVKLQAKIKALLEKTLPGRITYIVPVEASSPFATYAINGGLGVRIPADDFTRLLIQSVGQPLLNSSANRSGMGVAKTVDEIPGVVERLVDFVIIADRQVGVQASTVVSLLDDKPNLLRQGSESFLTIQQCWEAQNA